MSSHPHPPPQPLTTTNPLSVSADLPVLDVSHQWNHTLCVLLRLASLTEHRGLGVHPRGSECRGLHPFSRLSDVPVCGGTQWVHPSSADGRSGCFHFWLL